MKVRIITVLVLVLCIAFGLYAYGLASDEGGDTIYLKNGRAIKGIVSKEGKAGVELETVSGTIAIGSSEIKSIRRASQDAIGKLRGEWAASQANLAAQARALEDERANRMKAYEQTVDEEIARRSNETYGQGEVRIARDPDLKSVLVETVLNGDVKATLILDTGAAMIILSKRIGEQLGVDMSAENVKDILDLQLAGGKSVKARAIVLKSVDIQGIEEKDVLAAVMLEDKQHIGFKDGLLGRSFLNRFSITIDAEKMTMSLKKLKR